MNLSIKKKIKNLKIKKRLVKDILALFYKFFTIMK